MTEQIPPAGLFRRTISFSPEETDRFGRVRPDAVFTRMQDLAGDHYDSLFLGRDAAVERGLFWAVTRTEAFFPAPIPAHTELFLDTWIGKTSHGLFWRHYRILSPEGVCLLRAISVWVLMDLEKRILARDWAWAVRPGVKLEGSLPETVRGVPFPKDLPFLGRRTVTREETDVNGHLNNALYLPWAAEGLPAGYEERRRPACIRIEYRKELPLGQEAELYSRMEGDTLYLRGMADGVNSFEMRIDYDPI